MLEHTKANFKQLAFFYWTTGSLAMNITDSITLKVIKESIGTDETVCEVLKDNQATKILIHGKVLEQAIHVTENRYLVFTTDDVIFEESLNIYLIEIGKGILDKLWIAQPYNTDIFSGVEIIDQHSLIFSFLYLKDWKLIVHDQPKLSWSIYHWLGFFQGFKLLRYLNLRFMPNKTTSKIS